MSEATEVLDDLVSLLATTPLPLHDGGWVEANRLDWFEARDLAERVTKEHAPKKALMRIFLKLGAMP